MSEENKTKLRIILSGGGVRGVYQAGVISRIMASGKYTIDEVYGCSIGALNAPMIASGNVEALVKYYLTPKVLDDVIERRSFLGIKLPNWDIIRYLSVLFKMGAYKRIRVEEMLWDVIDREQFDSVKHKCHVVAYNVTKNVETWFTGNRLLDGIRCSTALWLAVPPVEYENDIFVDGGACEAFASNFVLQKDKLGNDVKFDGKYLFVDLDSRQYFTRTAPTNALALMSNIHTAALCKVAELQERKLEALLGDDLIIIRPDHDTTVLTDAFDLDQTRIRQTLELGYSDAERFLKTQDDINEGITFNQVEFRRKIEHPEEEQQPEQPEEQQPEQPEEEQQPEQPEEQQ